MKRSSTGCHFSSSIDYLSTKSAHSDTPWKMFEFVREKKGRLWARDLKSKSLHESSCVNILGKGCGKTTIENKLHFLIEVCEGLFRTLDKHPWWSFYATIVKNAIWYQSCNLKNVRSTHKVVLLLVKLQDEACKFTKSSTPPWVLFVVYKLYKCTELRKASHISLFQFYISHWLRRTAVSWTLKMMARFN